jgi:hypothetical protein
MRSTAIAEIEQVLAHRSVAAIVTCLQAGLRFALNVTPVVRVFHSNFAGRAVEHRLLPVLHQVVVAHHQGAGGIFGRHIEFLRILRAFLSCFCFLIYKYSRKFCSLNYQIKIVIKLYINL